MTNHSSDLASLVPPVDVTRRGFTLGSLAVGFALAARPVRAETRITTDAAGLEAGAFTLPVSGFDVPCYFARPAGGERLATILVAPEIFGLHEHIADVCRRFAHEGFLAIAFDPFVRQGDVTTLPDVQTIISTVVSKTPDAQVMADLDAIAAHAAAERGGDPERLGITGFCWGGRTTWLYTAHNPKVKAGVAWYGRLVGPSNEITPRQPVEVAADLAGPTAAFRLRRWSRCARHSPRLAHRRRRRRRSSSIPTRPMPSMPIIGRAIGPKPPGTAGRAASPGSATTASAEPPGAAQAGGAAQAVAGPSCPTRRVMTPARRWM